MTKVNLKTNASYNFVAPEIDDDANKKVEVNFPTAEVVRAEPADGAIEVTVKRQVTIIGFEEKLDADLAFTMLKAASVGIGASVIVMFAGGDAADRTVSFTGDVMYPDLTVRKDQPAVISLVFDGENFLPASLSASGGGADGADGASAYEIWLLAGNAGTEADFLNSLKGADGGNGVDGVDGKNGKSVLSGAAVPNNGIGEDGEHYIDIMTYDLYKKDAGLWSSVGNIKGASGTPGDTLSADVIFSDMANGEIADLADATTTKVNLSLTGDTTLNLGQGAGLKTGSILILKAVLNTNTLTGGGTLAGKVFTDLGGVISETYVWNGEGWF